MCYSPEIYGELFNLGMKEYYPTNTAFNQRLDWIIVARNVIVNNDFFSTHSKADESILTACRNCALLKNFPPVKICLCDTIVWVFILTFHNFTCSQIKY